MDVHGFKLAKECLALTLGDFDSVADW
jgi:hypothetical protein